MSSRLMEGRLPPGRLDGFLQPGDYWLAHVQGPPGVAEPFHPEVSDPHVGADAGAEPLERPGRSESLPGGAALSLQRGHEVRTPEDPGIPQVGLPAPPEGGEARPAAQTPEEAAALEFRPAPPGDALG
jgi:hypothetical protein